MTNKTLKKSFIRNKHEHKGYVRWNQIAAILLFLMAIITGISIISFIAKSTILSYIAASGDIIAAFILAELAEMIWRKKL